MQILHSLHNTAIYDLNTNNDRFSPLSWVNWHSSKMPLVISVFAHPYTSRPKIPAGQSQKPSATPTTFPPATKQCHATATSKYLQHNPPPLPFTNAHTRVRTHTCPLIFHAIPVPFPGILVPTYQLLTSLYSSCQISLKYHLFCDAVLTTQNS